MATRPDLDIAHGGTSLPADLRTHRSSVLEKVLEYRFLAALTTELLKRGVDDFAVLRSDVDCDGSDIVIEAAGIIRHIQLKGLVRGGTRANVTVLTRLAAKPSGCVVWMVYEPDNLELGPFRWFGSAPGAPLPPLGDRVARHSKANTEGIKAERPAHRVVRGGLFERIDSIAGLADRLFGTVDA